MVPPESAGSLVATTSALSFLCVKLLLVVLHVDTFAYSDPGIGLAGVEIPPEIVWDIPIG